VSDTVTEVSQEPADEYDYFDYIAEAVAEQVPEPEPPATEPEPPEPDEPESPESEEEEPQEPPEIFWIEGLGYTIAWRVLPTLEYERIHQCNCQVFSVRNGIIDARTGLVISDGFGHGHGGHMSASWVYDIERGLFGHPGEFSDGVPFMFGMHPLGEFEESVVDRDLFDILSDEWRFENPRRFFSVESVDSSLREDFEWESDEVGGWRLTEDAFNGSFALMYNMELLTDFIFDEVVQPWSLAGSARWQGNWGVINREGYMVVPFVFEHILLIDEHTAFAKYDGAYGILDLSHTLEALQNQ